MELHFRHAESDGVDAVEHRNKSLQSGSIGMVSKAFPPIYILDNAGTNEQIECFGTGFEQRLGWQHSVIPEDPKEATGRALFSAEYCNC